MELSSMDRKAGSISHRHGAFALRTVRQGFWLALLLLHFGGIRAAWHALNSDMTLAEGLSSALRLLLLLGSSVFFALKVADVPRLRLKAGWRPFVAAMVVVGFLHINVLHRAVNDELTYTPAQLGVVLVAGAVVEMEIVRRIVLELVVRLGRQPKLAVDGHGAGGFRRRNRCLDTIRPPLLLLTAGLFLPRPPPLG